MTCPLNNFSFSKSLGSNPSIADVSIMHETATLNTNNAYTSEEVKIEQKQKSGKKYRETGQATKSERKYTEKLMNDPERHQKKLKNKSEWGKKSKFCEVCNRTVTNDGWSQHKKTKLHLENVEKS